MTKREFLAASAGAGLALAKAGSAFAQQAVAAAPRAAAKIPSRTAKTTKLFKTPPGFPNGIAVAPEGLWIAEQKESGAAAGEAAVHAARTRLRPILMTSFAFILGVAPLAVATGAGAEMRRSLGTAVLFGMLGVTCFGLLFTPAFYTFMRNLGRKERT